MPQVVLASASPARRWTLRAAGIEPVVLVSDVDEDAVVARHQVSAAPDVALLLARAKAEDVAARVARPADALVVGADSVLELDGQAHGKPGTVEQARARWHRMRGRSGVLHTGHWVVDLRGGGGRAAGATGVPAAPAGGGISSAVVEFADLSDAEVDAYVDTGEPLQVAGAFTLDGLGGAYVRRIEGDPHGVVGLSLPLLRELLAGLGVPWHSLWTR